MLENESKKEPGYLEQLEEQYKMFCAQRDQAQTNLQQLVGAIYACEVMIKKHKEFTENLGDVGNDKACSGETE